MVGATLLNVGAMCGGRICWVSSFPLVAGPGPGGQSATGHTGCWSSLADREGVMLYFVFFNDTHFFSFIMRIPLYFLDSKSPLILWTELLPPKFIC